MIKTKKKSFLYELLILAAPIALQNLINFVSVFTDSLMISRLGDTAASGLYAANQPASLLFLFTVGAEGGIVVLCTQYAGKGDVNGIKKTASAGIKTSVALALLLTLVCFLFGRQILSLFSDSAEIIDTGLVYLRVLSLSFPFFALSGSLIATARSVGNTKIGMYVLFASCALKLLLNYILIFGKLGFVALGILGAAISFLISRIFEALAMLIYMLLFDKKLAIRTKELLSLDTEYLKGFLKCALPILSAQAVWSVNTFAGSYILGRVEAEGVLAALSVSGTLFNLLYVITGSTGAAVGIMIGNLVGSGEHEKIKAYSKKAETVFISVGILALAVFLFLRKPFVNLFGISSGTIELALPLTAVIALLALPSSYQSGCMNGLIRGGGNVYFTFLVDLVLIFLITLPLGIIALRAGAPLFLVFAALKIDQPLKCIISYIKVHRYKWIRELTRNAQEL